MIKKDFKLLDFQKDGVNSIYSSRAVIIGDEMGLGKSLQALAFSDWLGKPTLIVCPAYLINNWKQEIAKFLVKSKATFEILSYDALKKKEVGFFKKFSFVVADEIQQLKNMKAQRTEVFHMQFKKNPPQYFAGLSGTPIQNRISEFYALIKLLSMHPSNSNGLNIDKLYDTEESFCDHFAYVRELRVNGFRLKRYSGVRNLEDLKKLLKKKYIRRLADDILDLPELREKEVSFPLSEIKKMDARMRIDFEHGASHISTTKAVSALAKAQYTAKYAIDIIEEVGSVVIFTDHVEACKALFLGVIRRHSAHVIKGSTPSSKRQGYIDEFQKGRVKALICTIGAAGVGFTMTRASNIVFNDVSWVPGLNAQAIKRIHRIGQSNKCCVHYILGSPIDEKIVKTVRQKEKDLKKIL